jgi:hypothetical protein
MKHLLLIAALCGAISINCMGGYGAQSGSIFTSVSYSKNLPAVTSVGAKKGEACASSILGLIAFGDASLAAAAQNGGITTVKIVDYSYSNVLGALWTGSCTIAHGD